MPHSYACPFAGFFVPFTKNFATAIPPPANTIAAIVRTIKEDGPIGKFYDPQFSK
jgi:hypothetical protein